MTKSFDKFKANGLANDEKSCLIEWETAVTWQDVRQDYQESRMTGLGYIGNRRFCGVFVYRADTRRIISLRKANSREIKPDTQLPTDEEDADITAAALSDSDALPYTDSEWEQVKPLLCVGGIVKQQRIAINFDREVIDSFRATGNDWQARMNDALKDWLKEHAV